jgi:hypothetical protein
LRYVRINRHEKRGSLSAGIVGGTTRGVPVSIDSTPSAAWRSLHEPRISALERDRPYQSWGTERVYVDQDQGTFLSLVHMLEMHIVQKDGALGESLVTKHWREDWRYQPTQIIEFKG